MLIEQEILTRISQVETIEETKLTSAEEAFLVRFLLNFVERTIQKFIKGKREHCDTNFLSDVEPMTELESELIDAPIYLALLQYKLAQKDNENYYKQINFENYRPE